MYHFQNVYIVILRYTNCAVGYVGLDVWWLMKRREVVSQSETTTLVPGNHTCDDEYCGTFLWPLNCTDL